MSDFVLIAIPQLADYPFLLILTCVVLLCFFGGFIFASFWNLITGFFK